MIKPGMINWMRALAYYKGLTPQETEDMVSGVCMRDAVATNPVGMTNKDICEDYWIYCYKIYPN